MVAMKMDDEREEKKLRYRKNKMKKGIAEDDNWSLVTYRVGGGCYQKKKDVKEEGEGEESRNSEDKRKQNVTRVRY